MTPVSALNLFKIFPTGLLSKKDIGTLRSLDTASSCNFLLALAPVHWPVALHTKDKSMKITERIM